MEEQQNGHLAFQKAPGEKRLVVIDGNHLIHRAFYAIQAPLTTKSGEPTNAIYGFASMLLNIIEAEEPDYMAMTFDEHAPTFRHEVHEEYKGTRQKAPDELYSQIPRIKDMVKAFNMPIFSKEGYEADDMMGTLAKKAKAQGITPWLVTGDMDLLQLVDDVIRVVFPHKGYKEPIVYTVDKVVDKYGITPDQVVDYKSMVGDSSDNIKGVDGIGPKGAQKLLNEYKTLDGIYENINNIAGGTQEKLIRDKDQAYFAQHLARIVTDVPCDFSPEAILASKMDYRGLEKFLHGMDITSLDRRLKKLMPPEQEVPENQMSLF